MDETVNLIKDEVVSRLIRDLVDEELRKLGVIKFPRTNSMKTLLPTAVRT